MKLTAVTALLLLQLSAFGQAKPDLTRPSFERARQVLDAGIEALGGLENIKRADKVSIHYDAVSYPVGQSFSFGGQPPGVPREGVKTFIDFGGGRYVSEGQSNFTGGYKFNFRVVVAPKRSFNLDLLQNRRGNTIQDLNEGSKANNRVGLLGEVPHLLLLYVSQRRATLRWLGETEAGGRRLRAVSFAAENGTEMSLYFDARTNLLVRTEQLGSSAQLGDVTSGNTFSDYQALGNVKIPRRRTGFFNQYVTGEYEYREVKLDFAEGEGLLAVPAGFVEAAPAGGRAEPLKKMGEGVYLTEQGGYRVMFVEFADHVVVLEAPVSADASRNVINLVKQVAPNKPIRYVAFSHFHFDHTAGLREYIAEGVTVVVPPGNKAFVERIAASAFTLRPDSLALKPRAPVVETFEKKRVFADGGRAVELYNISPVSHVADMTMFYFPKEKILFQGDMFSPLDAGGGIPPVIEAHRELVKKVDELGLEVETLIGVHSGAVAWKDFRAAVTNAASRRRPDSSLVSQGY